MVWITVAFPKGVANMHTRFAAPESPSHCLNGGFHASGGCDAAFVLIPRDEIPANTVRKPDFLDCLRIRHA
jgi:hypothetical protein